MSGYIPFTDEQKEKARRTDLAGLLRSQGEALRKSGSELEWLDGSQKVTIRGNLWFHQYEQVGGDTIDFVRKFYHKSYPEAMERIRNVYEPYHKRLKQLVDKCVRKFGFCLLLDCHSMPSLICNIMNEAKPLDFCLCTLRVATTIESRTY